MLLVFVLGLAGLFYCLGRSADLIIFHIRVIAERLGAPIFLVGIILGVFTSLPEITIGVNAVARNVEEVSFGNLMGGTVVLFSLLLGLSIVLNRSISTIGDLRHLPILSVYVLLPLLFGFDNTITWGEGMVMVVSYLAVLSWLYWSYRRSRLSVPSRETSASKKPMTYNIFMLIIGCVLVSICAALIMRITVEMLSMFEISPFVLGLVVFSLGTNLPELIVTIRSWQRKAKELSISNLIGSAITNVLTIGSFALITPMHTGVGSAYYILVAFLVVLTVIIAIFHRTRREFSEQEGVALVALYALFIMMQFYAVRYL
jgi:cation:H+ antiporter